MKFFFSHTDVIDNLHDETKKEDHHDRLHAIAEKLESFGAEIVDVTRFNVVVEMAEHRVRQLFELEEHMFAGFVGKVESRVHALFGHINHVEICPPEGHNGY